MRTWRWYSKLLFALLVAAFAYWVWPTPWVQHESPSSRCLRVHRVTGRVEALTGSAWISAERLSRIREARRQGVTDSRIRERFIENGIDPHLANEMLAAASQPW